jgi:hypothetical protein
MGRKARLKQSDEHKAKMARKAIKRAELAKAQKQCPPGKRVCIVTSEWRKPETLLGANLGNTDAYPRAPLDVQASLMMGMQDETC